MNKSLELFTERARSTNLIKTLVAREQEKIGRVLTGAEVRSILKNRLVCKCERFALPSTGYTPEKPIGECDHCGYHGLMMTVKDYIITGSYK